MTEVPVQAEELHLRRLEGRTGPTDRDRIHRTVSTDGTEIVGSVHGQGPPLVLVHGSAVGTVGAPTGRDLPWTRVLSVRHRPTGDGAARPFGISPRNPARPVPRSAPRSPSGRTGGCGIVAAAPVRFRGASVRRAGAADAAQGLRANVLAAAHPISAAWVIEVPYGRRKNVRSRDDFHASALTRSTEPIEGSLRGTRSSGGWGR
jgi:hypothetical protein